MATPVAVAVAALGGLAAVAVDLGRGATEVRTDDVITVGPSTSARPSPTAAPPTAAPPTAAPPTTAPPGPGPSPPTDPFARCSEADLSAVGRSNRQWWWDVERLDRDGNGVLCD